MHNDQLNTYRNFTIRIRSDLFARIEELAERTQRSRNNLICLLLKRAVEHCKLEAKNNE